MGFSRFRVPEYLYQTTSGLFIFRIKVPHDCLPAVRQRELQYSLRTRCIYSARKHLASILPFIQGLYGDIKQGLYDGYPQPEVTRIIKEGIRQAIVDHPVTGRHPQVTLNEVRILAGQSQVTPDASPVPSVPVIPAVSVVAPPSPLPPIPADVTFSDLQAAFFKEKEVTNGWRFKTEEDHRAVFNLFIEILGDISVKNIDKSTMRDFKSTIIQLPPNMRKVARYMHKSIPQIVAMQPEKTLSAHTINKYISRLSNLFSYAVSHGYMNVNPAGGLKVKLQSRPDEEREAYSTDDLKRIFREPETHHSYCYWAPLIALYTGCRLEEICQLHLADIRQDGGVWIFDINDKGEKNLKNLSSIRLIPIHHHLIELGLLSHVESLKASGVNRLFPELRRLRDGYGQTVSKWYQLYKKRCGIADGKTFHSFRHTFITHLKHKQVDPFMIHELDGHTIDSETMGRYGKRYTPEILLREAIEKIDYEIGA